MPEAQKKKTTKRRRGPQHTARWLSRKDANMLARAVRVYNRFMRYARLRRKRNAGTGEYLEMLARSQAQRCASAHGAPVEAGLVRGLRTRGVAA